MRFYAPTDVYLEKDCVKNHSKDLTKLGTKAFIITGRHSSSVNGSLQDVTSVLEEAAIPYEIFNDIEENPSIETVVKASEAGKAFGADFVIGIGGGSPLDASKAIALLMANPEETADCLYTPKELKPLPIAAVPTTCGTGSEVTPNAVLTIHEKETKKSISYHLYPDLALVDGKYLRFASRNLLINTVTDALAHCIESNLHAKNNPYNSMFSSYGMKLWAALKPYLMEEEEAEDHIYDIFMLASTVAGMAIAQTGTSLPHALSYEITYHYGVPHGKACGLFLAAYLKLYQKYAPKMVREVLNILEFNTLDDFRLFLKDLLGEVSITEEELERYADNIMANPSKLSTWPFEITRDEVRDMLAQSLIIR